MKVIIIYHSLEECSNKTVISNKNKCRKLCVSSTVLGKSGNSDLLRRLLVVQLVHTERGEIKERIQGWINNKKGKRLSKLEL